MFSGMNRTRIAGIAIAVALATITIWLASIFWPAIVRSFEVSMVQILPTGGLTQINYVLNLLWILVFWLIRKLLLWTELVSTESIRKVDGFCSMMLERSLSIILASGIALAFLTWYPHFLYWPWWMDLEHFAVSAHMWDLGVRPYRDLIDFNFPGPIYFMWILGKTFGWDRPMIANVIDGLVVLGICSILTIWSRKRLGSVSAGLFASALMLRYYFSLDYARVMQRDWYVAVLGISSICLIQSTSWKYRWVTAGLLMSVAGIIRPYAILFLPPIGLACLLERKDRDHSRTWNLFMLAATMVAGTVSLWLPLVFHGLFDDFLSTFAKAAAAGSYRSSEEESMIGLLIRQSNTKIIFTGLAGLVLTSIIERKNADRFHVSIVWLCALVSMLFYMPICPVRHAYTEIPVEMVACVGSGVALKCLIDRTKWAGSVKLVAVLVWFTFQFPGLPQFCSAEASLQAFKSLAKGEMIEEPPPGCRFVLGRTAKMGPTRYSWDDYVNTLDYVRKRTTEETYVVNFLWLFPFPAINGPTGRPVLWPCAEGLLWVQWIDPKLENRFAESLRTDRPVLAISHDESYIPVIPCPFPIIEKEIESSFEEIASFGKFRISKRRDEVGPSFSNSDSKSVERNGAEKSAVSP